MVRKTLFIGLLFIPTVTTAQDGALALVCEGGGVATGSTFGHSSTIDADGDLVQGNYSGETSFGANGIFELRSDGKVAELRGPPAMMPRSRTGWTSVKNFSMSENEITGRIKSMPLKEGMGFTIDRRTGIMATTWGFQGTCRTKVEEPRKF